GLHEVAVRVGVGLAGGVAAPEPGAARLVQDLDHRGRGRVGVGLVEVQRVRDPLAGVDGTHAAGVVRAREVDVDSQTGIRELLQGAGPEAAVHADELHGRTVCRGTARAVVARVEAHD